MPTREEAPWLFERTDRVKPRELTAEEFEELDDLGWDFHLRGDTYVALRRAGTAREEQGSSTPEGLLQAVRETEARLAPVESGERGQEGSEDHPTTGLGSEGQPR